MRNGNWQPGRKSHVGSPCTSSARKGRYAKRVTLRLNRMLTATLPLPPHGERGEGLTPRETPVLSACAHHQTCQFHAPAAAALESSKARRMTPPLPRHSASPASPTSSLPSLVFGFKLRREESKRAYSACGRACSSGFERVFSCDIGPEEPGERQAAADAKSFEMIE